MAVVTCHRRTFPTEAASRLHQNAANDRVQWVRETWLPDAQGKVDVKFFYGKPDLNSDLNDLNHLGHDEVTLPVGDDYFSLVAKVREMVRWAYDHGYDYMLKLDDDVYVNVDKTLAGFDPTADYRGLKCEGQYGTFKRGELAIVYACGPAYWISRKSMKAVLDSPIPTTPYEDRAMGDMLATNGIALTPSTELMVCLCRDCLTVTKPWAQAHVEDPTWRERFRQKYQLPGT